MKPTHMNFRAPLAVMGFLAALACAGQAYAERVVGQVTAADLASNVIDIDGIRYRIPAAALERSTTVDTDKLARSLKPGQPVKYEAERGEIRYIQPAQDMIDLPQRSRGAKSSGDTPPRR